MDVWRVVDRAKEEGVKQVAFNESAERSVYKTFSKAMHLFSNNPDSLREELRKDGMHLVKSANNKGLFLVYKGEDDADGEPKRIKKGKKRK